MSVVILPASVEIGRRRRIDCDPRSHIDVSLLGEIALSRSGEPLPLPASRKTRALFVYLLLCAKPVRRERLCELFFDVPDDPRAALRWSLSKIRAMLGVDAQLLTADRERVSSTRRASRSTSIISTRRRRWRHLYPGSTSLALTNTACGSLPNARISTASAPAASTKPRVTRASPTPTAIASPPLPKRWAKSVRSTRTPAPTRRSAIALRRTASASLMPSPALARRSSRPPTG